MNTIFVKQLFSVVTLLHAIALNQVFPKPIVLTTKPRIDAIRSLHTYVRLGGETVALGKTRISAIGYLYCNLYQKTRFTLIYAKKMLFLPDL